MHRGRARRRGRFQISEFGLLRNTLRLPAEAHTARCTAGTVGSTSAAEENGIVLFSGIRGGTRSKQQ